MPKSTQCTTVWKYWESVVGSVIQATGTVQFEDELQIGNHLKAWNGLQRVSFIPGIRPGAVHTPRFLQGQTELQSSLVWVAAWSQAKRWVLFSAGFRISNISLHSNKRMCEETSSKIHQSALSMVKMNQNNKWSPLIKYQCNLAFLPQKIR